MKQRTVARVIRLEGIGLHTGAQVAMEIHPAPANSGYRFQRMDLEGKPVIQADVNKVVATTRGTTIQEGSASVATIEHTLSALAGFQIDNALICMNGPEAPILDGSASLILNAIQEAGYTEQEEEKDVLEVMETVRFRDPDTDSEYVAMPAQEFQVTALIDFNSNFLGQQFASLDSLQHYGKEIGPSRTFCFLHEIEGLIDAGLIKGGDLDNAIVIVDRLMTDEEIKSLSRKLNRPGIHIDQEGYLNTTSLRFKNEPARHKLLDVIGDLALVGKSIRGKIVATKPGHKSNVEFARFLKKELIRQKKEKEVPTYDPDKPALKGLAEISQMLPHRFPFLLVDKIIELSDTHVVGIKNVTFSEYFFQGHFPGNPIMPGVLQIEALAQTGGILALSTVPDPWNWDTFFVKIDNTKFRQKVVPGDTLIMKMELMEPIRRGICHMNATAYVGSNVVTKAELTAQIVRRESNEPK